jgi:hypothetical protein
MEASLAKIPAPVPSTAHDYAESGLDVGPSLYFWQSRQSAYGQILVIPEAIGRIDLRLAA